MQPLFFDVEIVWKMMSVGRRSNSQNSKNATNQKKPKIRKYANSEESKNQKTGNNENFTISQAWNNLNWNVWLEMDLYKILSWMFDNLKLRKDESSKDCKNLRNLIDVLRFEKGFCKSIQKSNEKKNWEIEKWTFKN